MNEDKNKRIEPTHNSVKLDACVLMSDLESGDVRLMDKDTRRRARNLAVDYNLVRLRSGGIPDNVLGFLVKSLHFHTPYYFFLVCLLLSSKWAIYIMFPLVVCLVAFFYFDGCFLTIIEYRLMGEDINIIDPYIYWMGDKPTPKSRFYYTLGVSSVYFSIIILITLLKRWYGY